MREFEIELVPYQPGNALEPYGHPVETFEQAAHLFYGVALYERLAPDSKGRRLASFMGDGGSVLRVSVMAAQLVARDGNPARWSLTHSPAVTAWLAAGGGFHG